MRLVALSSFHGQTAFPEAAESQTLQEGSPLARKISEQQASSKISLVGYTPWRDRPLLPLLTASEIAGVSPSSLYALADQGRLRFRQLAGRTLVDTESLIALLNSAEPWVRRNLGDQAREKRKAVARAAMQG